MMHAAREVATLPLALAMEVDLLKSGRKCKGIDTYFGGTILHSLASLLKELANHFTDR